MPTLLHLDTGADTCNIRLATEEARAAWATKFRAARQTGLAKLDLDNLLSSGAPHAKLTGVYPLVAIVRAIPV